MPPLARDSQLAVHQSCPALFAADTLTWFEPYVWTTHVLRRIATAMATGRGRVIVNAPPRHGKSVAISQVLPIWALEFAPAHRVLVTAHSRELAIDFGRKTRNEFKNNHSLTTRLREDSKSAGRWNTPEGGGMYCVGVGGGVTGFGGHLIVVDDPYPSWAAAQSYRYRREVQDWFTGTLYNRLEPGGTIVVNHTRFHPEDLSGFLLSSHGDKWEHVCMPAMAEHDDPIGRYPKEALCPERYSAEELLRIEMASGFGVFPATYQQRPQQTSGHAVYGRFSERNYVQDQPAIRKDLPISITFDWNINPGMHALVVQYDSMHDTFTVLHEIHGPRMDVGACLKEFGRWMTTNGGWQWPECHVFGDASGSAKSVVGGQSAIEAARIGLGNVGVPSNAVRIRIPKANPRIADRIAAVNDALCDSTGKPHVFLRRDAAHRLVTDFQSVQTDDAGGLDKSDPMLTHPSDALGYMVHYLRPLRSSKPTRSESRIIA